MKNLTHGVDYLNNYYTILGVEQDSSVATIRSAYLEKQKQYHPDRYQGLAPELASSAEFSSRLCIEAYEVLSDDIRRAEYDTELTSWKGPISKNGTPIIDLSTPHFSFSSLMQQDEERDKELGISKEKLALHFSGFSSKTFNFIQGLYENTDEPDTELVSAYREGLKKQALHLSLLESFAWTSIGFRNKPIHEIGCDHFEDTKKELARLKSSLAQEVANALLRSGNTENLLLTETSSQKPDDKDENLSLALAKTCENANRIFELGTTKILKIAKEANEVNLKRLTLLEMEYVPEQTVMHSKIIVVLPSKDKSHCSIVLSFDGTTVTAPADEQKIENLDQITNPDVARSFIDIGYNVILVNIDELGIKPILEEVVNRHLTKLAEQQSQGDVK